MIGVPASAVTREQLAAALQHLPTRPDPLGGLGNRLMVSAAPRCPAWATAGCRLLDARRTRARGPIHTPSRRPPPPQHPSPQPPQRNAPPQARGHHLTPPPPAVLPCPQDMPMPSTSSQPAAPLDSMFMIAATSPAMPGMAAGPGTGQPMHGAHRPHGATCKQDARMDMDAAQKAVLGALAGLDLTTAKQNLDASKAAVSKEREEAIAKGEPLPNHRQPPVRRATTSSLRSSSTRSLTAGRPGGRFDGPDTIDEAGRPRQLSDYPELSPLKVRCPAVPCPPARRPLTDCQQAPCRMHGVPALAPRRSAGRGAAASMPARAPPPPDRVRPLLVRPLLLRRWAAASPASWFRRRTQQQPAWPQRSASGAPLAAASACPTSCRDRRACRTG